MVVDQFSFTLIVFYKMFLILFVQRDAGDLRVEGDIEGEVSRERTDDRERSIDST